MPLLREKIETSIPVTEVWLRRGGDVVVPEAELHGKLNASYTRGWDEGCRTIQEQLVQQRTELARIQNEILASIRKSITYVLMECEQTVLQLVAENVRKIVGTVPVSAEFVEGVVREALSNIKDNSKFCIRLHPDDMRLLESLPKVLPDGARVESVELIGDESMQRGDCIVTSRFGTIDARKETKLKNMERALSW